MGLHPYKGGQTMARRRGDGFRGKQKRTRGDGKNSAFFGEKNADGEFSFKPADRPDCENPVLPLRLPPVGKGEFR